MSIEHGSIEIIRGVGNNSTSEGLVFGPEDNFDDTDLHGSIEKLTGVKVNGNAQNHPHPENRCKGVFPGKDADGKQCKVKVWVSAFPVG